MIILQMDQYLKAKNISDVPGQLFCCQCKDSSCYRQFHCIDYQDNFQSVKDTYNEFTQCQTPRKND